MMGRSGRTLRVALSTVALLFAAFTPASAPAHQMRTVGVKTLSLSNPFHGNPTCQPPGTMADAEMEPHLAVNPTDPENIVAGWMQDRVYGPVPPAPVMLVASSSDDGGTWTRGGLPGTTLCTGGPGTSTADPIVSFGPEGTAYFASLQTHGLGIRLTINRSLDGGRTWLPAVAVDDSGTLNDREVMAADPTKPGRVYVVWDKADPPDGGTPLAAYFSRSEDFGQTWSTPKRIGEFTSPVQLLVLLDGTVVYVDVEQINDQGQFDSSEIRLMRSSDHGGTWERVPAPCNAQPPCSHSDETADTHDPDTGSPVDSGRGNDQEAPSVSAAPDGTLYAAWQQNDPSPANTGRIMVSKLPLLEAGGQWSTAQPVARASSSQAFLPTIAVTDDGTVGLTYYDFRKDVLDDHELTTDAWFAHSHDGGRTWEETHVLGPFDSRSGSTREIADYMAMAPAKNGFAAVFPALDVPGGQGESDIVFARFWPGRAAGPAETRVRDASPIFGR